MFHYLKSQLKSSETSNNPQIITSRCNKNFITSSFQGCAIFVHGIFRTCPEIENILHLNYKMANKLYAWLSLLSHWASLLCQRLIFRVLHPRPLCMYVSNAFIYNARTKKKMIARSYSSISLLSASEAVWVSPIELIAQEAKESCCRVCSSLLATLPLSTLGSIPPCK